MRTFLVIILAVSFLATSCKKYPDGPGLSLKSKAERLANAWKIDVFFENGVDKTTDAQNWYNNYILTIDKAGTYGITYKILSLIPYSETGTWAFNGDKSKVTFTRTSPLPVSTSEWTILKLMEDELWGQYNDSTNVIKVHLKP
jgi:hypothetical protein